MTPDASVIVAAFAPWHPLHDAARKALRGVPDLVAHAELEAYSVLTRLPPPFRADASTVADYLRNRHRGARLVLPAAARKGFVGRLATAALSGGSVYDSLIAATATHHEHELLSCDRRAVTVYETLGTAYNLIDD